MFEFYSKESESRKGKTTFSTAASHWMLFHKEIVHIFIFDPGRDWVWLVIYASPVIIIHTNIINSIING